MVADAAEQVDAAIRKAVKTASQRRSEHFGSSGHELACV